MKRYFIVLIILIFNLSCGQEKECFCKENTSMNESTVNCETVKLKNKNKLYWQFNCERIWLTLEKTDGVKLIIDEVPVNLYPYAYRIGFHLLKENKKTLLFRSGCAASGSCNYILIDKNTGKQISKRVDK